MKFSHDEMMLIIQGLRLVNGIDRIGKDYDRTERDIAAAMALLKRIDNDSHV